MYLTQNLTFCIAVNSSDESKVMKLILYKKDQLFIWKTRSYLISVIFYGIKIMLMFILIGIGLFLHSDAQVHIIELTPSGSHFTNIRSACIIGWWSGLPDSLISTYIAQFIGCVIGKIHYGLKVVFCFRHFTAFHYHHYTRLLTGTEYI